MFGVAGILVAAVLLDVGSNPVSAIDKPNKCQEITIPMCRGIGYNLTYMPNQFNHDTQVCRSSFPNFPLKRPVVNFGRTSLHGHWRKSPKIFNYGVLASVYRFQIAGGLAGHSYFITQECHGKTVSRTWLKWVSFVHFASSSKATHTCHAKKRIPPTVCYRCNIIQWDLV